MTELSADYFSLTKKLEKISLSLFRKNMFTIFHGSISARVELNKFIINRSDAIFDSLTFEDFILLYHNRDYRWNDASMDSAIHSQIYQALPDAKYIAYAMPPYTMSYALKHDTIEPADYFGKEMFKSLAVFEAKSLDNWYDNAELEITRYFEKEKSHLMVIRGYGVYVHSRDITELAKALSVLENSCRILLLSAITEDTKTLGL